MPRGGKRPGAGRPSTLDEFDRLHVGAVCNNRFNEHWRDAATKAWEGRPGVAYLEGLQSQYRRMAATDRSGERGEAHRRKIEDAIRAIRRTPAFVREAPKRGFRLTAPRPSGVKDKIIAEVTAEFSQRLGLRLKPSFVRTCWDEYRAFQKEDTDV